ncbi:MAG: hypothetical protein EON59_06785 [Alphaproteobacteria bacterium]|nr:MAG: hypothetical protein EON59_06785 [Alphaproteobacteria bacterium]
MSANPDCKECGGTGWLGDWPNRHGCNYCYRQTAPSDHPTPGSVLTEADVPKLRKGDVLRVIQPGGLFDDGETVCFAGVSSYGEGYIRVSGKASGFYHDRFAFVSRPQPVSVSEHVSGDAKEGVEAAVERLTAEVAERLKTQASMDAFVRDYPGDWGERPVPTITVDLEDLRTLLASHEAQAAEIKARDERIAALCQGLRIERDWHERRADMAFDDARECSERGEKADERAAMDRLRSSQQRIEIIDATLTERGQ